MEQQPRTVHDEQEVLARTVAVVMRTAVVTVAVDETVLVAWELMERSGSRHLPVVRPDGRCAGLLDRADVAVACAAPASSLSGLRVGDLLPGHRPALVHAEQTVRHAADLMSCTEVDALPVLGEDGRLAGVLTAFDVVAALSGRPVRREPAETQPQAPPTVLPGLPPRRGYRGTAVP
ncbi:HPP family protein [Streptomyces sp. MMG1533]|uniref:CBS domain-containing protein n=1 Tax=Streptomyces sp. MMG1533 TaxID=1415546 RepID=UPI0006AF22EC|nr:CBS domain-containing protein [Streptomyces sp. MMG1533]